jgi:hypothetical protein
VEVDIVWFPSPPPSPTRGEGDNRVIFCVIPNTKKRAANKLEIGILNLDIIWDLSFGVWNLP